MGIKLKGLEVEGTTHAVDIPEDIKIVEKLLKKVSGQKKNYYIILYNKNRENTWIIQKKNFQKK